MQVKGIHHVTAITANIRANLRFYTEVLGLRLVKKSVNQDDISAYHLFYADAVGSPGTDMTFFDWPSSPANRPGPGNVEVTNLRVSQASLPFWRERLGALGVPIEAKEDRLQFADPEGQALALVADDGKAAKTIPFSLHVPAEHALRGLGGVEFSSVRFEESRRVLTELLGFEQVGEDRFETQHKDAWGQVILHPAEDRYLGRPGAGGIHHVAFRVENDDDLRAFQQRIEAAGYQTSGYVDRFYFHSLYFREPGGVLFELATEGPGFDADEPMGALGERLALPPFLEGRRAEIETGLIPL